MGGTPDKGLRIDQYTLLTPGSVQQNGPHPHQREILGFLKYCILHNKVPLSLGASFTDYITTLHTYEGGMSNCWECSADAYEVPERRNHMSSQPACGCFAIHTVAM